MRIGLRTRWFLVALGLVALSLLVADVLVSQAIERSFTDRIREDLVVRLELARRGFHLDAGEPDALADDLARRAGARITLVRADGVVIGDSEVSREGLAELENHGSRPEIAEALARGQGASVRHSSTIGHDMIYVALPSEGRDGVIRAAVPLAEVAGAVGRVRGLLLVGSLATLGLVVLVAWAVTRRLAASVQEITEVAGRLAKGDLTARTRSDSPDELGALARSLDQVGERADASLEALRAERDRMAGIVGAMHEGVLVLSEEGRVTLVNPALREMLLLGADVVGRTMLEVIRHPELPEIVERARLSDEPVRGDVEVEGLKPRRFLVHASRLPATSPGTLAVLVDVTELRRLETLRRDFVANVSHELRTPVTTIRSSVETLKGGAAADPAAAARFLDIVERNAARLQQLVEDLLDLSRIESRQYRLQPESIELGQLLGHAVSLLRQRAEARRLKLVVEPAPGLPAARADRRALEQVVANLVDNAVKYTGEGCTVRVAAASLSDREIEVAVSDDGPGIEARHLPRLFERFYRVDAGRSREQGGTGLGLSIVKHLVEAMGGRVRVESDPGRRTTFAFTVPRS